MERDLIGVGAGPANLSLASLLTTASERGLTSITATFFERADKHHETVTLNIGFEWKIRRPFDRSARPAKNITRTAQCSFRILGRH